MQTPICDWKSHLQSSNSTRGEACEGLIVIDNSAEAIAKVYASEGAGYADMDESFTRKYFDHTGADSEVADKHSDAESE